MMLPDGWVTDVLTTRTKALKALGNGVVPLQAEHALRLLLGRLDGDVSRELVGVGSRCVVPDVTA